MQDFLEESLGCALNQTYKNIEVILVDDGSTDSTPAIYRRFSENDDRLRVIRQENGGISAARNTGVAAANGDFLYFFDPDDRIELNLIEWCVTAMRNFDADIVMFKFDAISLLGKPLNSQYDHNLYDQVQVLTATEAIKQQLHGDIAGYLWAFMAKTAIYRAQNLTFPVGRKIEDLSRICTILGDAKKIVRLPQTLYHYRLRSGSAMGQVTPSLISDWSKAVEDREDYILTHYPALKGYMLRQSLAFFSNLDYESMRQSLIFGLKLDPDSVDQRAAKREKEKLAKKSLAAGNHKPHSQRYYGKKKHSHASVRAAKTDAASAYHTAKTHSTKSSLSKQRRAIKKFTKKLLMDQ
jgi:glycosyltransferase involved in cell wall biosynthesis